MSPLRITTLTGLSPLIGFCNAKRKSSARSASGLFASEPQESLMSSRKSPTAWLNRSVLRLKRRNFPNQRTKSRTRNQYLIMPRSISGEPCEKTTVLTKNRTSKSFLFASTHLRIESSCSGSRIRRCRTLRLLRRSGTANATLPSLKQ